MTRVDPAGRVDSPRTGWKFTEDGSDADEGVAPLGSWHKEAWAEWQQREHVKQAMQALEEGGGLIIAICAARLVN